MAVWFIPALAVTAIGAAGNFMFRAGNAVADDIDAAGDIAIAAGVGFAAGAITKKPMLGLLSGVAVYALMQVNEGDTDP
ncbi:MAG: hypothetical protein AAGF27_06700 [Pseudomonadota bacterium]